MIEDGLFERFGIERAYGLHLSSKYPAGTLGFCEGPMYASSDSIEIEMQGIGGHGSAPHDTVDPIYASANFITSVQQVVSRQIDPMEPAVVTIGSIHGGTTHNVIPRTCKMLGTVRAFSDDVRDAMPAHIERVLRSCCELGRTVHFRLSLALSGDGKRCRTDPVCANACARPIGDANVIEASS